MKRFLAVLLLFSTLALHGQPILRNSATTNTAPRTPTLLPTSASALYPVMILNPDGTGADRQLLNSPYFFITGTNASFGGDILPSGRTNRLSISSTNTLLMDGVPVIASSSAAPINNFWVTNLFATNITVQTITSITNLFTISKGGNLTITTNITIMTNSSITLSNLPWPSVLIAGSNGDVTNATLSGLTLVGTTLTATGGGGASVWIPNTALSYSSGTNVTIDGSGGTNFVLTVTNTTFFATPSNLPGGTGTNTTFTVFFKQDSTGGRLVSYTNTSFKFPGGTQFQPLTNANSVSWVTFTMSPFTNSIFMADYGVLGSQ